MTQNIEETPQRTPAFKSPNSAKKAKDHINEEVEELLTRGTIVNKDQDKIQDKEWLERQ